MKNFKQIEGTLSSKLTLGLHADLQMRLHKIVTSVQPAKLLLEADDLTAWKRDIDTESDVARAIEKSEETELMTKKDAERDRIISSLFQEIRQSRKSPIALRAEAGRRLKIIVDTYKKLQWESLAEETAHVTGLLSDLAKHSSAADIAQLGLQPVVDLLGTVNADFDTLRTSRSTGKAADLLPTAKKIRQKNDATLTSIFHHIEAACLTAEAADRPSLESLIDKLNQVIEETKTTHSQTHAKRKDSKKPGDGSKKKPDGDSKKKPEDKGGTKKPEREEDPGEDQA